MFASKSHALRLTTPALFAPLLLALSPAYAQVETKLQSDFESAKDQASWQAAGGAKVVTGVSHSGTASLSITRDKTSDDARWTSNRFPVKPGEPYRFSAWLKSEKIFMPDPSFAPEVHVIFHNAVFADVGEVSFADYWKVPTDDGAVGIKVFSFDWRYFEKLLTPPPSAIGARIEFKFNKTSGTAWMDDVKVTYEPGAVLDGVRSKSAFLRLWPARAGQNGSMRSAGGTIFKPGEPLDFFVKAPDAAPAEGNAVSWIIRDALLRPLASGSSPVTGTSAKLTLPNQDAQLGRWLQCDWTWNQNGKALAQRTTSIFVQPQETPPGPGVFGSYGNPGDYELLKQIGVNIVRSDIFWRDDNQPSPDKPVEWKGLLHERMAIPVKHGLKNLGLLSWQSPKWAWLRPDGLHEHTGYAIKPEAVRQAAFDTVSKYKDSVQYWQLGNEVNLHDPQMRKDYIADFIAFSAGVKAADPNAKVVLGSQNRSLEDIQLALEEGALPALDIIDYHYADVGLLRAMRAHLDKVSPKKHIPIWETELGFFTQDIDDIFATNFLTIMAGAAGEGVENAVWCWLGGIPHVSELEEESPALTRGTYLTSNSRQPSQLLAQHILLADFVQGAQPVKPLEWGRVKGYLFRRGEINSAVIWAEGLEPVSGSLKLPATNLLISDWTGRRRQLKTTSGLPMVIGRRPWLLRWTGSKPGADFAFTSPAPLQLKTQRSRVLYKGTVNNVTVSLAADAAPQSIELDAGREAEITPANFTLQPGATQTVQVKIPADTETERLTLDATVNGTASWLSWEYNLRPALTASITASPRSNLITDKTQPAWLVRLVNNGSQDVHAKVQLASFATADFRPTSREKDLAVPKGSSKDLLFPLDRAPSFDTKYIANATVSFTPGHSSMNTTAETGFLGVARATKPPVIDGNLADWAGIAPAELSDPSEYWRYHDDITWKGPQDLSAKLYFRWDPSALYFAADVTDDVHVNEQDPANIWNADSVELGLQPAEDISRAPIVKVIMASAHGKPEVMVSAESRRIIESKVQSATIRANGHTYYEACIPWPIMVPLTGAAAGQRIRAAVMLNEDDGHGRAAYMNWFGRLTYPTKGEAQFTDLTLMP